MKRLWLLCIVLMVSLLTMGQTVLLDEDFDDIQSGVPAGWDNLEGSVSAVTQRWGAYTIGYTGSCVRFDSKNNVSGATDVLKSPVIQLPSNDEMVVRFMFKNANGGNLSLYVLSDDGLPYTQHVLYTGLAAYDWEERSFSLAQFKGHSVRIVWHSTSNQSNDSDPYHYLDNVVVEKAPTCKSPANLYFSNITQTSVDVSWGVSAEQGDLPSSYQMVVQDENGVTVFSEQSIPASVTYWSITGLQANSTYTVQMRGDCRATMSDLSRYVSYSFTTLCAPSELPYVNDFDDANVIPGCCYSRNASINTTAGFANGGSGRSVKLNATDAQMAYIIFPLADHPTDSFEVAFWIRSESYRFVSHFQVGLVTDPVDPEGTFIGLLQDSLVSSNWREVRVNSAGVPDYGVPVAVCIFAEAGFNNPLYLDDVDVHAIPSCPRPEGLVVRSVNINSVTLDWGMTSAPTYNVRAVAGADTVNAVATGHPYVMGGLQANTDYTFTVSAVCGAGDVSEWSLPLSAKTLCDVRTDIYSVEDFENVGGSIPDCWTAGWINKTQMNQTVEPFQVALNQHHSGNKGLQLVLQDDQNISYVSTQKLRIPAGHDVSFWMKRSDSKSYLSEEGIKVWVNSVPNDTAGGTLIGRVCRSYKSFPQEVGPDWYEYSFEIPGSGDMYVIFVGESQGGEDMWIDDVCIKPSPLCRPVRNIRGGNPTSSSVSMAWDAAGNESQWVLVYSIDNGGAVVSQDSIVVNKTNYTFSGLQSGVRYNVRGTIYAYCAPELSDGRDFSLELASRCLAQSIPYFEDFSSQQLMSVPVCWDNSMSTSVAQQDYFFFGVANQGANRYMRMLNDHGHSDGYARVTSPEINLPAGGQYLLTFDYRNMLTRYYGIDGYQTVLKASTDGGINFTTVDTLGHLVSEWTQMSYDLSAYAGHNVILMFEAEAASYGEMGVDNVFVRIMPSCPDVRSDKISYDHVLPNSVEISLEDIDVVDWELVYVTAGSPVSSGTIVTVPLGQRSILVTGLTDDTEYEFYYRRICSATDKSSWNNVPLIIHTMCLPASLPFIDEFETQNEGRISGCYRTEYNSESHINVKRGSLYNHTPGGSKGLISSTSETSMLDGYTSTTLGLYNYVHLDRDSNYEISVFAKRYASQSSDYSYNITFYYGQYMGYEQMSVIGHAVVDEDDWREYKAYFNVDVSGDYYIGFASSGLTYDANYYLMVDDYQVKKVHCIPPTYTVVSAITANSAKIDFQTSGTRWEVAVDTTWFDGQSAVHGNIYHNIVDSYSVQLLNLEENTTYYYSVRTLCSEDEISDWRPTESFHTRCSSYAVPFSEGFDDKTVEQCWITTGDGSRNHATRRSGSDSYRMRNATLITPEIQVQSFQNYVLTGWAYAVDANSSLDIGVMTDPGSVETFETLASVDLVPGRWVEFTQYFDALADDDYEDFRDAHYIVFSSLGTSATYIDDILLDTMPTCPKPLDITVLGYTAHDVSVGWTPAGSETSWIVRAEPLNSYNTAVIDTVTYNPCVLSGLDAAAPYRISVAAVCTDESSHWKDYYATVTTACDYMRPGYREDFQLMEIGTNPMCWSLENSTTVTIFNNPSNVWGVHEWKGARMLRMRNRETRDGVASIMTPEIALPATGSYEFLFDYSHNATCGDFKVNVRRVGDPVFTNRYIFQKGNGSNEDEPTDFQHVAFDLSQYSGDTIQIEFWTSADYKFGSIFLDNIELRERRSCADVVAVNISQLSHEGATATIVDSVAAHAAWQYVIVTRGADVSTGTIVDVTAKTFSFTGLNASTEYDLYVRSYCSDDEQSYWMKKEFRTTASAAVFPFYCDFEDEEEFANWQIISSTDAQNVFVFGSDPTAVKNGSHALYISDDGTSYNYDVTAEGASVAGRILEFDSKQYIIDYNWYCSGGEGNLFGGAFDYARAYVVPASTGLTVPNTGMYYSYFFPSNIIPIDGGTTIENVEGWQHSSHVLDMRGKAGRYYIVFAWSNNNHNGDQRPFSVNDLTIREMNCLPVTDLKVKSVTDTSATIIFQNNAACDTTEWAVSLENNAAAAFLTGNCLNDSTIYVTGLQRATSYYLFVRNSCGDSEDFKSPWQSINFVSDCGANDVWPFYEDFESQTFPPVCWTETDIATGSWYHANYTSSGMNGYYIGINADIKEPEGAGSIMATPKMHFDGARDYELSFLMHHTTNPAYSDYLDIYLSQDPHSFTDGIYVGTYSAYDASAVDNLSHTVLKELPRGVDGDYYVLFVAYYFSGHVNLDDITLDILPPCRNFEGVPSVDSRTASTMNVSIDLDRRTGVQFAWAPMRSSGTTVADTIGSVYSSTGSAVITGLLDSTEYCVYARGFCFTGDTTAWTPAARAWTYPDDCFAPDNLRLVGTASGTKFTAEWGPAPLATLYNYELLYAGNVVASGDTTGTSITLTGLSPLTAYTLRVRTVCQLGDATAWSTLSVTTSVSAAEVPYICGFEDIADNNLWIPVTSSGVNNFVAGTSANGRNGGSYGLYISGDRRNYNQKLTTGSAAMTSFQYVSYMTRTVYFEPGTYEIAYDWKCDAYKEVTASLHKAYGRAFLASADVDLVGDQASYSRMNPAGAQSLYPGEMSHQATWTKQRNVVTITEPGNYLIVFGWFQNTSHNATTSNLTSTPLAIDNVEVTEVTCMPTSDLHVDTLTYNRAVVSLGGTFTGEYALITTSVETDAAAAAKTAFSGSSITLSNIAPITDYYLFVRSICAPGDTSTWRYVHFLTPDTTASLPYVCDFEDAIENSHWHFTQTGQKNYFIVGNKAYSAGAKSLYVTKDGSKNEYVGTSSSVSYAYRDFYFEPGTYEYAYDWRCEGRSGEDYGRVFIMPADVTLTEGILLHNLDDEKTPAGVIAIDGGSQLIASSAWTTVNSYFNITEPGLYKMVILWSNLKLSTSTSSTVQQPPMGIDNIAVRRSTCLPIHLSQGATTTNSIDVNISNANAGSLIEYTVSQFDGNANVFLRDTIAGSTITLTDLVPSSTYFVYARALCGDDDPSLWANIIVRTSCGVIDRYPYYESFESLRPQSHANQLPNICWEALNTDVTTIYYSSYPYYSVGDEANNIHTGSRALKLISSAADNMYIVMPEMDSINDLRMTFWYRSETTGADCGNLTVGYIDKSLDMTTFVGISNLPRITQLTEYSQDFTSAPADKRIAFRLGGATSDNRLTVLDDIRVTRMIDGPTFHDTICYNTDYLLHGFNVPVAELAVGPNTLRHIKLSTNATDCDTIYHAEVYVRPEVRTDLYDTVCANTPYVKGEWNIPNPVSRTYMLNATASTGCDSVINLYLTVLSAGTEIIDTICTGGSYMFRDTLITDPGQYIRSYTNSFGCIATDTLYLMVLPDTVPLIAEICEGDYYDFHGQQLSVTGTYYAQIIGPRGCPQTERLDLTVFATDQTLYDTICQGVNYIFGNQSLTASGTYQRTYINAQGCDVTETLYLTVTDPIVGDVTDYACEGHPYTGNGVVGLMVTKDTTITVNTRTAELCDSISNVHLIFVATEYHDEYAEIQSGENYVWNEETYNITGDYPVTLYNQYGCDSVVTLHLTVKGAVDNVSLLKVDIIPNPVRPGMTATLYGDYGDIETVEVLNSLGAVIDRFTPTTYPVEVTGIDVQGIYYVRLITASGDIVTQKLIVR